MRNVMSAIVARLPLPVLGRQRFIVAVVLAAGAATVTATSALAQSPPLTGEVLACSVDADLICPAGTPAITDLSCPATGAGSFNYAVSGPATGPYSGTFTEMGTVTSGPLSELPPPLEGFIVGRMETALITFTIQSPEGFVTGRKRLTQPSFEPFGFPGPVTSAFTCVSGVGAGAGVFPFSSFVLPVCYVARLPNGTIDRGSSKFLAAAMLPGAPTTGPRFAEQFGETFASDPSRGNCGLLPSTTLECKRGGWKTFAIFKNQGDCVAWVATRGTNAPG